MIDIAPDLSSTPKTISIIGTGQMGQGINDYVNHEKWGCKTSKGFRCYSQ